MNIQSKVAPMKLLVRNARLLTMVPGEEEPFIGWFTVATDGTIAALGTGGPPPGTVAEDELDAAGRFVAPGFVSAHSHLFTSGSRGLGIDVPLYGWGEQATRYSRECEADDIYWLTLHGSLDFLGNGITTAYDFTDTRLTFTPLVRGQRMEAGELKPQAYAEAQFRAKVDAGLRFVNSVLLNEAVGTREEVLARFEAILRYADSYPHGGYYLRTAISGAVQWSPSKDTAALEAEAMRRFGVINQPHFLETSEELELQRSKFAWYREAGAFGPDLIFGHFVQATEEMIREAASCGCGMVWQPTSNGRLASGVANIPVCVEAGMRVGVGLDDQSCTDISDPWQNMRIGIYMQRAHRKNAKAMGVAQMLRLHTLGSAETLGIDDRVGSLEPGKYADFLVVDPRDPDTGPVWNPVATYVLACGLRNLKAVYVGGELASDDGRSTNPQAAEASDQLHTRLGRIARNLDRAAVPMDAVADPV